MAAADTGAQKPAYMVALPWGPDAIGGVTHVVLGLYDGIEKDGRLRPSLLVSSWNDPKPVEAVDASGRSLVRMRIRSPLGGASPWYSLLRYLLALPQQMWRIRGLVRRHAVAVVNCHYIGSSDFTWVLAKRLGVFRGKVLLSLHGLDIRTIATSRGLRRLLWRWALVNADAVVACSDGLADETRAAFELPPSQVITIHNGVDVAQLDRLAAQAGGAGREPSWPSLLNLGTFEYKKGHDVLLRAFQRVVERHPGAHLTIMGRRAGTTSATLELVDRLGLARHTTIRTDVPHGVALLALAAADLFVLPSRNEAFSIALLEAGALGKPVVATDVCGVPELIQDGVTGARVPPEDADALADAILRVLQDHESAMRYGRRLRDLVLRRFTLDANCSSYLRLAGYPPL